MLTLEKLKCQKLIIYGAGFLGRDFIYFCKRHNIPIFWILDKKFVQPTKLLDVNASSLEYFLQYNRNLNDYILIIAIIKPEIVKKIKENLINHGVKNFYSFEKVLEYKDYLNKFYSCSFLEKETSNDPLQNIQITSKAKVGVIFHCYYLDLLEEFLRYLSNINDLFDLYISIPPKFKNLKNEIFKKCTNFLKFVHKIKVLFFPNRGRDIYPFLKILKKYPICKYDYVLKLHTKKSNFPKIGELWRKQMCIRLIGSSRIYEKIKSLFKIKKTGLVIPLGYAMEIRYYLGDNFTKLQKLLQNFKIPNDYLYSSFFPLGSMFWFKPEVCKDLQKVDLRKIKFEEERGQIDGTWAHAFERFFGILPTVQSYKVMQIDEEGSIYEVKNFCKIDKNG